MPILEFRGNKPILNSPAWIAPTAWLSGEVTLHEEVGVFFGASLRGDIFPIFVGRGSNLQDNAILHTSKGIGPCIVGENVTVGHGAILHGCTVSDHCIIGMGCTILDRAVIGENCIVGANALVTMDKHIPPRSLVVGAPAKVVREITQAEYDEIRDSARRYRETSKEYARVLGCGF